MSRREYENVFASRARSFLAPFWGSRESVLLLFKGLTVLRCSRGFLEIRANTLCWSVQWLVNVSAEVESVGILSG